jgi:chemotaxis protein MotB
MHTKKVSKFQNPNLTKKKKKETWIVTFADMTLNLMTFFILLLTFANMDLAKFKEMMKNIQKGFGVVVVEESSQSDQKVKVEEVASREPDYFEQHRKNVAEEIELEDLLGQLMKTVADGRMEEGVIIHKGHNAIRLRIGSYLIFEEGEADIKPSTTIFLDEISNIMKLSKYYLTVEGHTDDIPISSSKFPSNWELSSARASRVIRYLIDQGISPDRMAGLGLSSYYPVVPNTNQKNRSINRRVELIITKTVPRIFVDN